MNRLLASKPLFDFLVLMIIFAVLLWLIIGYLGLTSHSVFYAWAIVALNAVIGYVLFEYAFAMKSETFLRTALLGQAARLFIVALLIALLMLTRSVDIAQFAWAALGFYACYLPIEVLACLNKMRFEKKLEKLLRL